MAPATLAWGAVRALYLPDAEAPFMAAPSTPFLVAVLTAAAALYAAKLSYLRRNRKSRRTDHTWILRREKY